MTARPRPNRAEPAKRDIRRYRASAIPSLRVATLASSMDALERLAMSGEDSGVVKLSILRTLPSPPSTEDPGPSDFIMYPNREGVWMRKNS